jgi:hypothetical protein
MIIMPGEKPKETMMMTMMPNGSREFLNPKEGTDRPKSNGPKLALALGCLLLR